MHCIQFLNARDIGRSRLSLCLFYIFSSFPNPSVDKTIFSPCLVNTGETLLVALPFFASPRYCEIPCETGKPSSSFDLKARLSAIYNDHEKVRNTFHIK